MTADPTGELSPPLSGNGPVEVDVVRSEERVRVSTQPYAVGRARVRKVVVTEERTITVQVRREELQVDEEPGATDEPVDHVLGSAQPLELILHEQRPVITYETVPVERVRIGTRVVTEQRTVSADVRREVVELSGDGSEH